MDIFFQAGHSVIDNWKITLSDQVGGNLQYLRQKNPFRQQKFDYFTFSCSEREVRVKY